MASASHTAYNPTSRSEAGDRVKDAANAAVDKAAELADRAGAKLDGVIESASSMVKAATDGSQQVSAQAEQVAGNLKSAIDRSLKDQPMTTLALAALTGVVIGALWKS